jgi:hypothetical protein
MKKLNTYALLDYNDNAKFYFQVKTDKLAVMFVERSGHLNQGDTLVKVVDIK